MLLARLGTARALMYWEYYLDDVLKFVRAKTPQSEEALGVVFATMGVSQANVFSQAQYDLYNLLTQSLLTKISKPRRRPPPQGTTGPGGRRIRGRRR
jgi:hypothetical protein